MKPVEGVRAAGASWIETMRFAALPQVLASFASYALLRFEINVRGATVIGFVGAGGIGQDLMEAIRKFYYSDVSAILVLIIARRHGDRHLDGLSAPRADRAGAIMSALANAPPIDVDAVKQRHRAAFRPLARARRRGARSFAALLALYVGAFVYFDVPWGRLLPGLRSSAWFVREWFRPIRAGICVTYLNALGETLAISLARHPARRGLRAAARPAGGAQRRFRRPGCACRSSVSSTRCAASTR